MSLLADSTRDAGNRRIRAPSGAGLARRRALGSWTRSGAMLALAVVCAGMLSSAAPVDTRVLDAVRRGDLADLRHLLEQQAPVEAATPDGTTALHWAVRGDRPELVQVLLRAGAQANAANRYGVTPLALAAVNGSGTVVRLLLEAGADPNLAGADGETPLMIAARTGRPEPVSLLLAHGAKVNATETWQGETALMWAAGENQAEVVTLLAAHGAELNVHATVPDLPKVKQDFSTMAFTALPHGGFTAMMFAARQGALEAAGALADAGVNLAEIDPDGSTALLLAIINAHYDVAALLIERGAAVNPADTAGMTPLYAVVDMQHQEPLLNRPLPQPSGRLRPLDVVSLLLAHGADPNLALKTPLLMRQHNFGDALLGEGATPLMRAAKVADVELMRTLLDNGAEPGARLKNQTTALMIAAARSARNGGPETQTIAAIQLLLDRGADINAASDNGDTALHLAVGRGDAVVRFLVEHGASLEARDKAGRTPLDVARGAPNTTAGRGRDGQPPPPGVAHETTAALLEELAARRGPDRQ